MKPLLTILLSLIASGVLAQPANPAPERQSARIIQTVEPIFPQHLIPVYRRGGQVRILISVSSEGRLNEWLVVSYTDREFADAAVVALKRWEFEPARIKGEAVSVCAEISFHFEVKGVVVSVTSSDLFQANFNELTGGEAYAPCMLRDIDRIPVPQNAVPPVYPESLAARGVKGDVTVEFYIDEQGAVRMPYVTGRPQVALAELAVDAVRQWKFEPPTRRGRPALVLVRQLFHFSPAQTPAR